jgi:hypothetical protein
MKEILLVLPGYVFWKVSLLSAKNENSNISKVAQWQLFLPFSLFGVTLHYSLIILFNVLVFVASQLPGKSFFSFRYMDFDSSFYYLLPIELIASYCIGHHQKNSSKERNFFGLLTSGPDLLRC